MRVGIVALSLSNNKGSMRRYVKNLISSLNKIGKSKEIALITNKRLNFKNEQIQIKTKPNTKRIFQLAIPKVLKQYNLDVIHYPDSVPLNFKQKTPVVFTFHGIAPLILPTRLSGVSPLKKGILHVIWKYVSKKVDIGITVSHSEKKEIEEILNIDKSKLRVIYHGIDKNKFKPLPKCKVKSFLQKKYNITEEYIFHLSNYQPKKNVLGILKALSLLDKKPMLIIGGNPKGHLPTFKRAVKKYKIEKYVVFLGYVPDEDIPYLYNGAEAFVFPSFHESFGFPILEAMACGTPVITSNVYSMPEIAGDAGVYVNPFNVSSIKEGIIKIVNDKNFANKKAKEGLRQSHKFSWDKCARLTFKIYEETINS